MYVFPVLTLLSCWTAFHLPTGASGAFSPLPMLIKMFCGLTRLFS